MSRYRIVVLTNAVEGCEDEFNEWVDGPHIGEILAIPGINTAQRLRAVAGPGGTEAPYRYLNLYEVETDDPDAVRAGLADPSGRVRSDSIDLTRTQVWMFEEIGEKRRSV